MTASYNRRDGGGQSPDAFASDEAALAAARRAADRLLLASCDASESAAAVRDGRRLLDHALRFVAAGSGEAVETASGCLEDLRASSLVDQAILATVDLATGTLRVVLTAGEGGGAAVLERGVPGLADTVRAVLNTSGCIEWPGGDWRESPPLAGDRLGSLRLSLRSIGGSRVLLVALHTPRNGKYWTPACRRLHEGFADILAAASGRVLAHAGGAGATDGSATSRTQRDDR